MDSHKIVSQFFGHAHSLGLQGDGRYLITNSKDQSVKLWDMRRFSSSEGIEATRKAVSRQMWDYRWQGAPKYCELVNMWASKKVMLCSVWLSGGCVF